jgi:hypothetical protein
MFQIFAWKQVFDVSATFHFYNKRDSSVCPMCPSCTIARETAGHILRCGEEGRVQALHKISSQVLQWMSSVGTDRDLIFLVGRYIRDRDQVSMEDICDEYGLPRSLRPFALSQDQIGWQRFLEGMVSRELGRLVEQEGIPEDCKLSTDTWMREMITRLLELTHSMWIYRNLVVHDTSSGIHAIRRKEALQSEIERQIELGGEGRQMDARGESDRYGGFHGRKRSILAFGNRGCKGVSYQETRPNVAFYPTTRGIILIPSSINSSGHHPELAQHRGRK